MIGTPFFTKAGNLHASPGYDPTSRMYYNPPGGFELRAPSARPSNDEVARAKALLLDDVLRDFPFDGDAERAHAVALVLLPFVRAMIDGSTPIHWIDKPAAGTGASKLVNVISLLSVGSEAEPVSEETTEDGWRKKISTSLLSGGPLFFLDNVNGTLDTSALATAVTSPRWKDRLLGGNTEINVPVRCAFIVAANNLRMSGEILRRCVRIRMDARIEDPTTRTEFKHADLEGWVRENRSELVWACLTLVQNWIALGRPAFSGKPLASFENWSRVMGGILDAAKIPAFLANRSEMMESGDDDLKALKSFVSAWWDKYRTGNTQVGGDTAPLFDLVEYCEPPLPLTGGSDVGRRKSLSHLLKKSMNRPLSIGTENGQDVTVVIREGVVNSSSKAAGWRLERVG